MTHTVKYTHASVFKTTYPRPNYATTDKIGQADCVLSAFQSKEARFREIASQFGLDHGQARFVKKIQTAKGLRLDLSYLLIPIPGSEDYFTVAHYS